LKGRPEVPSYLFQTSYTALAWAAMMKHPQDRAEAVRKSVEKLGGKITAFWLAFGSHDVLGVLEMPDNVSAAAFAIAVAAGGACKDVKTTPLLSIAEGVEAMKKAATSGYKPVSGGV
jgi:uncharacterized protein with GYD domain